MKLQVSSRTHARHATTCFHIQFVFLTSLYTMWWLIPQFLLKLVGPYESSSDSGFENHPLASEILMNSRGQSALSHRIEVAYAVISAASACH